MARGAARPDSARRRWRTPGQAARWSCGDDPARCIPAALPPPHPHQGLGEGGASAGKSTIGYGVVVKPRPANRIRGELCSPGGSVSEPAERAVCA